MSQKNVPALIESVSVTNLFGRRSYELEFPSVAGKPSRLVLLHGDNGSGKTTLLRLIWNVLSPAENQGHRTYIAKAPFSRLAIKMYDETEIVATKHDGLFGDYTISISKRGAEPESATYATDDDLTVRKIPRTEEMRLWGAREVEMLPPTSRSWRKMPKNGLSLDLEASRAAEISYLGYLDEEIGIPLYLADDRSLYSDDPDINRTRDALRRDTDRPDKAVQRDRLARLVALELQMTLRRVNDFFRGLTIGGQTSGSANSNAIYMRLLQQLAETSQGNDIGDSATSTNVDKLLLDIAQVSPSYEEFGLVPEFEAQNFQRLLSLVRQRGLAEVADGVMYPFLDSMKARYDALKEAETLLRSLVTTMNSFFSDKYLRFSPRAGLTIETEDGQGSKVTLGVEALSSGERQLLMLLCTTLLARIDTRLFIIDEPELSLGVEWQRALMTALISLTKGTNVQFLIATHSIEIISSHPESLVVLEPK